MTKQEFIKNKVQHIAERSNGCTEIGVIAYPSAIATNFTKNRIKSIVCTMSAYIYRNILNVGVPYLGHCGCEMIVAIGSVINKPEKKLSILENVSKQQISLAKQLAKKIKIEVLNDSDPVYSKILITDIKNNKVEVLIEGSHTNVKYVKINGKKIKYSNDNEPSIKTSSDKPEYIYSDFSISELVDIVDKFNINDFKFMENNFSINWDIANYGAQHMIKDSFTYCYKNSRKEPLSCLEKIIFYTAAGIDARMSGATLPVEASCGSGDHGLTVSIPQFIYFAKMKTSYSAFIKALCLGNLIVWYIKLGIGNLSFLCGSVVAACTGAIMGIAYQKKFSKQKLNNLFEALLCSYNSIVCDGAKNSCTHKVASALDSGLMVMKLVEKGYYVKPHDGIVCGDPLKTLGTISRLSTCASNTINNSIVDSLKKIKEGK